MIPVPTLSMVPAAEPLFSHSRQARALEHGSCLGWILFKHACHTKSLLKSVGRCMLCVICCIDQGSSASQISIQRMLSTLLFLQSKIVV